MCDASKFNLKADFVKSTITSKSKSNVKGSLKAHIKWWIDNGADEFILSVIREGYRIPFYETPVSAYLPNNKSALDNPVFVTEAIEELVKNGIAIQCSVRPKIVNPLTVAINPTKKRLILDLSRLVNPYVWK